MCTIVGAGFAVHHVPWRAERLLQPLEQLPAVAHLIRQFKPVTGDLAFPVFVGVIGNDRFHLPAQRRDGIEVVDVVDQVEDHRRFSARRRQRSADLLLVHDGGNGRAAKDHAVQPLHMHALVEHVDAVEQLQMGAFIRLKAAKRLLCLCVFRVHLVDARCRVHPAEPFSRAAAHFLQMLIIRAEDQVLAMPVGQMLLENAVEATCFLQPAAKAFDVLLRRLPGGAARLSGPAVVTLQLLLIRVQRQHILGRGQDAPHNGLTQGHFMGHAAVEQLVRHVALAVQVADGGGRQAQKQGIGEILQQGAHPLAPFLRAAAVELIQNDYLRAQRGAFLRREQHELGIGQKGDVFRRAASRGPQAG